jgi:DNA-directed RNA polymerase subunit F
VTIIKLLDMDPKHASTIRQIISIEKRAFTDEELAKIAAVFGLKEKGVA